MFNKLISNLPFNPSLIDQVSFYAKRLHKEAGIRRVGFGLTALAIAVQVFAVMAPAQANVSCDPSGNDVLQCGFSSQSQAVSKCRNNQQNFATILKYYNLNCDSVANAGVQNIKSTDYNRALISMGRKAYNKPQEKSIQIPGAGNLFTRPLWSWDTRGASTYKVLSMRTPDNQPIYIMYECGNIVSLNDYKPTQPEPDSGLSVAKVNTPQGLVKPGQIIDYTIVFANRGGTAAFFSVNDILPSEVSFVSSSHGDWIFENKSPNLKWVNNTPPFYTFGNTDAFGTPGFIKVQVKVNDDVKSGTTICNQAYLQDVPKGTANTRNTPIVQACNTVQIDCPAGSILGPDGRTCEEIKVADAQCVALTAFNVTENNNNRKFTFEAKANTVNGATISAYEYDFGNGDTKTVDSNELNNKVDYEFKQVKTYDVTVRVKTSVGDKPSLVCVTKVTVNPPDEKPIISISKKAKNITQKQDNAHNKVAQAGDVIEYTLTTTNVSTVDSKDTTLQPEDLSDVLEYATLDLNSLQGGVFDNETKVLSWGKKVTIKAGESHSQTFKVTVKNPIPSTPRPDTRNNRSSGDMIMQNIYGNTVTIKLPTTPVKTTEEVTTSLPNTGPGTSLAIGFGVLTVVGYFYSRSRLLAKELAIVKSEYTTTSGGL
jgi:uncharacterized repeat protein (TIGR01451 family)